MRGVFDWGLDGKVKDEARPQGKGVAIQPRGNKHPPLWASVRFLSSSVFTPCFAMKHVERAGPSTRMVRRRGSATFRHEMCHASQKSSTSYLSIYLLGSLKIQDSLVQISTTMNNT